MARLDVVRSGPGRPSWNMAFDRLLLERGQGLTLRLYGWDPPGLSLGFFQKPTAAELAPHRAAGIEVVRRLTGGGAILHAQELTYALAGPDGLAPFQGPVDASYRLVHDVILAVLAEVGVTAAYPEAAPTALKRREQPFSCFARHTTLDLLCAGRKLVGSAKRRRGGRALQHGSIILRRHPLAPETAALDEVLAAPPSPDELGAALAAALGRRLGLEARFRPVRAEELAAEDSFPPLAIDPS